MRTRKATRYMVRRAALVLRSMSDAHLEGFHQEVKMEPYKGPYMRTLATMTLRERARRDRKCGESK